MIAHRLSDAKRAAHGQVLYEGGQRQVRPLLTKKAFAICRTPALRVFVDALATECVSLRTPADWVPHDMAAYTAQDDIGWIDEQSIVVLTCFVHGVSAHEIRCLTIALQKRQRCKETRQWRATKSEVLSDIV